MRFARALLLLLAGLATACSPGFLSLDDTDTSVTPTPPSAATFDFTGRIVATQDGNRGVAGATVTVNGQTPVTTAADGTFATRIGGSAAAVTVSAPGYVTRTTTVEGAQNRQVTIDVIANEAPFDLDFFDRLTRGKDQALFPDFILRWPSNPNFILVTKFTSLDGNGNYVSTDEDVPADFLDRVTTMLPVIVPSVTGGRIQAGAIQRRPDARTQVESGWVQIEFANRGVGLATDLCGFGGVDIGLANGRETDRTGFARYYNAPNCACGNDRPASWILAHEIGHALGFGHTMPATDSVMSYDLASACTYAGFADRDLYHGAIAYTRTVGNTSPDNDPAAFSLRRLGVKRLRTAYACELPAQP